jgi:hypothetical protein
MLTLLQCVNTVSTNFKGINIKKGANMKNYLSILGAMALGAGVMFWFTQSEVRADTSEEWNCSTPKLFPWGPLGKTNWLECERDGLKCIILQDLHSHGLRGTGISCLKSGLF